MGRMPGRRILARHSAGSGRPERVEGSDLKRRWGLRSLERHEPALAVFAGAAGERHLQVNPGNVPGLSPPIIDHLDCGGLQEILSRGMIAMLVLDAAEQGELVIRTHVKLKRLHSGPLPVVYTLGIL